MGNKLILVTLDDFGYEWLYINGKLKATGEPIDADTWLRLIKKHFTFAVVESYTLTDEFGERVNGDYKKVPKQFSDFVDGDLTTTEV